MIAFDKVAYDYGAGPILADVSLDLAPGSFHFLTGPSGSGKSTFLKLCYGDLLPSAGRVSVLGEATADMSRDSKARMRRAIGVVHQDCQFLDHLPLAENVALPLAVSGQRVDDGELAELLGWVGLARQADALPPSLSG
ncbi:MAG: ATP-binding cassette domain-containing protein, partial [Rhodobacteraceae bacterium]|nr:ATP-binding cassette domain-containing protein [Paracoccaceae bacterium]